MFPTKRVEIISLGDELLNGIRENGHLVYLGEILTRHGLKILRDQEIRDDAPDIRTYFPLAWERADIVITTGGLGPTNDDITRETLSELLGCPLGHSPVIEEDIKAFMAARGRLPTPNNLRQAQVMQGGEPLRNPNGTAPGLWLERDGKLLIMLPGPRKELQPMVQNQVIPRLVERGWAREEQAYLQLRTTGIGESALADKLEGMEAKYKGRVQFAYCAHDGVVDLRLAPLVPELSLDDIHDIGDEAIEILGDDFAAYGDTCIACLILHQLRALGKTLAVAESCTGGLLAGEFTKNAGASKVFQGGVVCYKNDAKTEILDVPNDILEQHGAVSAECAVAMATGAAELFGADYALSVTGFAGPDGGTENNPVGTIYLGYHSPVGVWSRKIVAPGKRLAVRTRAVNAALDFFRRKLKKYEVEDFLASIEC